MGEKETKKYGGVYQEIVDLLTCKEDINKIHSKFKGTSIVFPQKLYDHAYAISYLKENRGKKTIKEMSQYLGLGDRRIRQILSEIKKSEVYEDKE